MSCPTPARGQVEGTRPSPRFGLGRTEAHTPGALAACALQTRRVRGRGPSRTRAEVLTPSSAGPPWLSCTPSCPLGNALLPPNAARVLS